MKKIILLAAMLAFFCGVVLSQVTFPKGTPQVMPYSYYKFPGYAQIDSGLLTPVRTPFFFPKQKGMLIYNPLDTTIHLWSGYNWFPMATQNWTSNILSGSISVTGYNKNLWDSAFNLALFDTTTRVLTLQRAHSGSAEMVTIPRGGNVTGMSALSPSRINNIITLTGDNGSVTQFSVRDADSVAHLLYTDTTAMLAPYLRKTDTVAMLAPFVQYSDTSVTVAPYLRKTDTAAMLSPFVQYSDTLTIVAPYLRKTDTAAMLAPFVQYSDTSQIVAPYLRKTDTATMLSPYVRYSDTSVFLRKTDTVTLVSTKPWIGNVLAGSVPVSGYNKNVWDSSFKQASFDTTTRVLTLQRAGSGSAATLTIPRGGSVTGMSALSSSRLNNIVTLTGDNGSVTQFSVRDVDSTGHLLYTDTTAMLAPYLRKIDTAAMLINYFHYSDTAQLVGPYLRKSDTATMLSGFIRNQTGLQSGADFNISGTGKAGVIESGSHVKAVANGSGDAFLFAGFKSDGTTLIASLNQTGTGAGALNLGNPAGVQTVLINGGGNSLINTGHPLLVNKGTDDGSGHALQVAGVSYGDTLAQGAAAGTMIKADAQGHLISAVSGSDYLSPGDTAALLAPYLRKSDTAAMLVNYFHYSDTAQLVGPYLRKSDTATMLSGFIRNQTGLQSGADFNISGTGKAGVIESGSHVKAVANGSGDAFLFAGFKSDGTTLIASLNQTGTGAGALNLGNPAGVQTVLINGGGNSLINTGHPLLVNKGTDDGSGHALQVAGVSYGDTLAQGAAAGAMVKADAQGRLISAVSGSDYLSPGDSTGNGYTTRHSTQFKIDSLAAALGGSGYVPYTGATDSVNLGNHNLTVYGITIGRGPGNVPQNTVIGRSALTQNTFGAQNVALGLSALQYNIIGNNNSGLGTYSLMNNLGSFNTGAGAYSLTKNTTGTENTSIGYNTLKDVTDGSGNTAVGNLTGKGLRHGSNNTFVGANIGKDADLDSMMNNNILVATGDGAVQLKFDSTKWISPTTVNYASNLGSSFGTRSLVDKGYVDSTVSSASGPSYLEGDFTPVGVYTTSQWLDSAHGHYVKIGKQVTLTVTLFVGVVSGEYMEISGLPFTPNNILASSTGTQSLNTNLVTKFNTIGGHLWGQYYYTADGYTGGTLSDQLLGYIIPFTIIYYTD